MAIKIYGPNKTEQRGGVGEGTKASPFYWYGKLVEDNPCVTGPYNNYDSFNEMDYTAEPIWVRVYLDAGTTYTIGQTCYGAFALCDEEFNSLVKADYNEQEISGVYCSYCLTFTPETNGVYLVKSGVTSGYPEEYKLCFNVAPNPIDTVPEIYDYQLTSAGFDNYGKPIKYRSLIDAGLLPLTDDKLLCHFTFDGAIPLESTNGKYLFSVGGTNCHCELVDSKAKSLGKGVQLVRDSYDGGFNGVQTNITGGSFLNDTDFTVMAWIKTTTSPTWNFCGGGNFDLFQLGSIGGNFVSISNSDYLPYVSIGACQDDNNYSNPSGIWRSTIPYPINEWWHFCYVYHNGTIYYFQDGKLALKVTPSFIIKEYRQSNYPFKIGTSGPGAFEANTYFFDDFRIYKRAVFIEDFTPPLK